MITVSGAGTSQKKQRRTCGLAYGLATARNPVERRRDWGLDKCVVLLFLGNSLISTHSRIKS